MVWLHVPYPLLACPFPHQIWSTPFHPADYASLGLGKLPSSTRHPLLLWRYKTGLLPRTHSPTSFPSRSPSVVPSPTKSGQRAAHFFSLHRNNPQTTTPTPPIPPQYPL